MNISRFLLVLVICLVFVIVGELIYLFYISPLQQSKKPDQDATANVEVTTAPINTPNVATNAVTNSAANAATNSATNPTTNPTTNSAISQNKIDALDSIKVFKEGVLQEAILNYQVGGKIIQIENVINKDEDGNDLPVKSIKIEGSKGLNNTFFFSAQRLKMTEVRNIASGETTIMKFEDLKVGDTINILYAINLLNELDYDVNIRKVIINKE